MNVHFYYSFPINASLTYHKIKYHVTKDVCIIQNNSRKFDTLKSAFEIVVQICLNCGVNEHEQMFVQYKRKLYLIFRTRLLFCFYAFNERWEQTRPDSETWKFWWSTPRYTTKNTDFIMVSSINTITIKYENRVR